MAVGCWGTVFQGCFKPASVQCQAPVVETRQLAGGDKGSQRQDIARALELAKGVREG